MTGLDNLQTVDGYIWLSQLPSLTSISSMNSLSSIGNSLYIQFANSMTSLNAFQNLDMINGDFQIAITGLLATDGLSNLQTVNGKLDIQQNNFFSDISNLQNINPASLEELLLNDNQLLSICTLPNICTYLAYDSLAYPRTISNNLGDCIDENTVINACNNLSINTPEVDFSFYIYTTNNILYIHSKNFEIEKIDIYDISGKLIHSKFNTEQESIIISNIEEGQILILKAHSKDGKISIKKIVT